MRIVKNPFDNAVRKWLDLSDEIILFENLRYWHGEEKDSVGFARGLARWGDIYVNDAFASSHRRHASIMALARLLPAYAGLRLCEEVFALERIRINPARPFIALFARGRMPD